MSLWILDSQLIAFCKKHFLGLARLSIFVVYFWFGILKVFGHSPASSLVQSLFEKTIPFMSFSLFLILFGIFEMIIGVLFLIKGMERLAIVLLILHMITTIMPLFVLPATTWTGFMVPTLEGQYIIKNILIIACAMVVGAQLVPLKKS